MCPEMREWVGKQHGATAGTKQDTKRQMNATKATTAFASNQKQRTGQISTSNFWNYVCCFLCCDTLRYTRSVQFVHTQLLIDSDIA